MTTDELSDADLSDKAPARLNETQKREVPMFTEASDLDRVKEHPHLGFGSNPGYHGGRKKK